MKLVIDERECDAQEGETILAVAKRNGISIPTMCHDDRLEPFGSCFICIVEVEGARTRLPACSTLAGDGMVVRTDTPALRSTRKLGLELLVSDHCGDCLPPCQRACPALLDAQAYIELIAEGRPRESASFIRETVPFPSAVGRICPHPCEDACRRADMEGPLSICALKRYAGDADIISGGTLLDRGPSTGKRVAVIGAGPGGLTCAARLVQSGHEAVVYERMPEPGGMLRWGIPSYRLPRDILAKEIDLLVRSGVKIECGRSLGADFTLDSLRSDGFDAVVVATGAQLSRKMRVEGEDLPAVIGGVDFLRRVALGEKVELGRRVMVVGGGNTAVDAARTALRTGSEVTILYRRSRVEMPALASEVDEAEEEGVNIEILAAPVGIEGAAAGLRVSCIRMELGEPDSSGRRRPVPIEGSEFAVEVDSLVAAIGQAVEEPEGVPFDRWHVNADERTGATQEPWLFALGDCVTGPDIAIGAIGAGNRVARSIDQFLRGEEVRAEDAFTVTIEDVPESFYEGVDARDRAGPEMVDPKERARSSVEVSATMSEQTARREAERCLKCGCAAAGDCRLRELAQEYGAEPGRFAGSSRAYDPDRTNPAVVYDPGKCVMCGVCVRASDELLGADVLGFTERGFDARVRPPFEREFALVPADACPLLVEMCPTGALTPARRSATAREGARPRRGR